jgi:hypothetical protein
MSDFDVCIGCGDIPTNELGGDTTFESIYSNEDIQEMIDKGYMQDSTGSWFDPTNAVDCYFIDW